MSDYNKTSKLTCSCGASFERTAAQGERDWIDNGSTAFLAEHKKCKTKKDDDLLKRLAEENCAVRSAIGMTTSPLNEILNTIRDLKEHKTNPDWKGVATLQESRIQKIAFALESSSNDVLELLEIIERNKSMRRLADAAHHRIGAALGLGATSTDGILLSIQNLQTALELAKKANADALLNSRPG